MDNTKDIGLRNTTIEYAKDYRNEYPCGTLTVSNKELTDEQFKDF